MRAAHGQSPWLVRNLKHNRPACPVTHHPNIAVNHSWQYQDCMHATAFVERTSTPRAAAALLQAYIAGYSSSRKITKTTGRCVPGCRFNLRGSTLCNLHSSASHNLTNCLQPASAVLGKTTCAARTSAPFLPNHHPLRNPCTPQGLKQLQPANPLANLQAKPSHVGPSIDLQHLPSHKPAPFAGKIQDGSRRIPGGAYPAQGGSHLCQLAHAVRPWDAKLDCLAADLDGFAALLGVEGGRGEWVGSRKGKREGHVQGSESVEWIVE